MIISVVNNRHIKKTHKFGIRIPRNAQEAHAIEKESGNTIWDDAMAKETRNVRVDFRLMKSGKLAPVGYQFIQFNGIWDVKID